MKVNVLSERSYRRWPSFDVVFEWEDIIAPVLKAQIITFEGGLLGKVIRRLKKYWLKMNQRANSKYRITNITECKLFWEMAANDYRTLPTKNIIPIFLDFPVSMVDPIIEATSSLPVFFVTCKDIYNMLIQKGVKNVRFMPLSISNKYFTEEIPDKTVDVIQFGRKNSVLHEYMLKYCEVHPDVDYVYQSGDGTLTYESTTRGNVGKFDTRNEYVDMIKSCRVSLVSTPGCDKGRSGEFGNIDFVTPRFFESAAFYCHMIGRYTENDETEELRLGEVCPNVKSYKEFEKLMDLYLGTLDWDWTAQRDWTKRNLTSERAKFIQEEIGRL